MTSGAPSALVATDAAPVRRSQCAREARRRHLCAPVLFIRVLQTPVVWIARLLPTRGVRAHKNS